MEAGAGEAVHKYQGGQTRPVPTRAHCGYSEEDWKHQEMVPDGTMVVETDPGSDTLNSIGRVARFRYRASGD
jgi:hypothetical protein